MHSVENQGIQALSQHGLSWAELFEAEKLATLHTRFLSELAQLAPETSERFAAYRASKGAGMKSEAISEVLTEVAPYVSDFVARLFGLEESRRALMTNAEAEAPIFRMQDQLVKRRALKRGEVPFDAALDAQARAMLSSLGAGHNDELAVAKAGMCAARSGDGAEARRARRLACIILQYDFYQSDFGRKRGPEGCRRTGPGGAGALADDASQ